MPFASDLETDKYRDKPVPAEAYDTGAMYAGERIFAIGVLRFLVNDENIVTFAYDTSNEDPQ